MSMRSYLTILISLVAFTSWAQEPMPMDLLSQVIDRCNEFSELEYTMEKRERVNGEMTHQRSFIRLQRDPFKIYMRQEVPREGLEALYAQGSNKDRILINPNGFPWINLNLSTRSGLVRRDQHHTIDHSGYDYFVRILSGSLKSKNAKAQAQLSCSRVTWLEQPCWKLNISNTNYQIAQRLITDEVVLTTLADSLHLCEYKIVELNKGLKPGEVVPAGTELMLPNYYAKEISIYINIQELIPVTFEIHDESGLYERYDYLDLVINPQVEESSFNADHSEYQF